MNRRERLERKLAKRAEWAAKAKQRSDARIGAAHRIADGIPLGQPILVGHHSEAHARRDQARIQTNMDKGVEELKLANHHGQKADGLERQLEKSVFSDDGDAIEQLEKRIADNEEKRDRRKEVNRLYRKGDQAGLAAHGHNLEKLRDALKVASSWGKMPYPAYSLTNIGARIRADRERIRVIQARRDRAANAEAAGGVVIEGEAYVRVTFSEKPVRSIILALKASGFTWSAWSWHGERIKIPSCVQAIADAREISSKEADDGAPRT